VVPPNSATPAPRAGVSLSGRTHQKWSETVAKWRGTIRGTDDLPEPGDLDGLARLVRQAIEAIDWMNLPDHERQAWVAEIEAAFEQARNLGCDLMKSYRPCE